MCHQLLEIREQGRDVAKRAARPGERPLVRQRDRHAPIGEPFFDFNEQRDETEGVERARTAENRSVGDTSSWSPGVRLRLSCAIDSSTNACSSAVSSGRVISFGPSIDVVVYQRSWRTREPRVKNAAAAITTARRFARVR